MKFQYYWDYGIFPGSSNTEGCGDMGTPADIQRMMDRIKRAQALTDRAASEGDKADSVMNAFEATLTNYEGHFTSIEEYNSQLAAMMAVGGNGGPPLEATFQSSGSVTAPSTT